MLSNYLFELIQLVLKHLDIENFRLHIYIQPSLLQKMITLFLSDTYYFNFLSYLKSFYELYTSIESRAVTTRDFSIKKKFRAKSTKPKK
jgi:hypothetical protein